MINSLCAKNRIYSIPNFCSSSISDKPNKESQKPNNELIADENSGRYLISPKLIKGKIRSIKPITTEEEYIKTLQRLKTVDHITSFSGMINPPLLISNQKYYPQLPEKLKGILPYAGHDDGFHTSINEYLSGAKISGKHKPKEEDIIDFIKCTEYSLNQLDKVFGKHNGYVFRSGYFSPEGGQYFSTSQYPEIDNFFKSIEDLHIIKVKNGHKIYELQNRYSVSNTYKKEEEVLMSPNSKYRKAELDEESTEYAKQLADRFKQFKLSTLGISARNNKEAQEKYRELYNTPIEELISKIHIWQEA